MRPSDSCPADGRGDGANHPRSLRADGHRCGKRMSLIAFVTDQVAIGKILEHLGLSRPEADKPPPPAREVLRVAEHADGSGVPAEWNPA